jgi:hypothetical protein
MTHFNRLIEILEADRAFDYEARKINGWLRSMPLILPGLTSRRMDRHARTT